MYTPRFLEFDYGPGHPLRNERLGLTYGLISARGLLSLPSIRYVEPEPATDDELLVFLKPDCLKVLKAADAGDAPPGAFQYGLGTPDNPILPGIFGIRNSELSDKAYTLEEVREEVWLLKRLVFPRHGI